MLISAGSMHLFLSVLTLLLCSPKCDCAGVGTSRELGKGGSSVEFSPQICLFYILLYSGQCAQPLISRKISITTTLSSVVH